MRAAPLDGALLSVTETANGPRAALRLAGAPAVGVPGRFLEAAFVLDGGGAVAFLTHGISSDEMLDICLLDGSALLESARLWRLGGADDLTRPRPVGERSFAFAFPTGTPWRLDVATFPRLLRPRAGVSRKGWRGRLVLSRGAPDKGP